jgi:hypothetical protein
LFVSIRFVDDRFVSKSLKSVREEEEENLFRCSNIDIDIKIDIKITVDDNNEDIVVHSVLVHLFVLNVVHWILFCPSIDNKIASSSNLCFPLEFRRSEDLYLTSLVEFDCLV